MRFKVPQFIDIEDKIFGPFTFKQFMYLGGGAGLAYIFYKTLPIFVALPLMAIAGGLAVALTFVKINGKPFIFILEAYIRYLWNSKMFIWKKNYSASKGETKKVEKKIEMAPQPGLTQSKLKELSWGLNVIEEEK